MIRRRSALMFRQAFVVKMAPVAGVSVGPARVRSWLAEEAGEHGDDFEQQGVGAGLLVGAVPGLVFGDGAAVLGLAGELADPGGHGRVMAAGPAGRVRLVAGELGDCFLGAGIVD
jgi:hypothetical protein